MDLEKLTEKLQQQLAKKPWAPMQKLQKLTGKLLRLAEQLSEKLQEQPQELRAAAWKPAQPAEPSERLHGFRVECAGLSKLDLGLSWLVQALTDEKPQLTEQLALDLCYLQK